MPSRSAPAPAGAALPRPFPELDDDARALELAVRGLVAHLLHAPWDDADVDDACHEVFRRAIEGRARWHEARPLRPWLLGIARHVALDLLRARRRAAARTPARGGPAQDDGPAALLEALADPSPGPDQHLQLAEQRARLESALGVLSAAEREALWLFHAEGLEYREIASRLGVPIGTVCTWMLRARRKLAARLLDAQQPSGGQPLLARSAKRARSPARRH